MAQVKYAALAHHGVVVQLLLEPLPEFHRPFEKGLIRRRDVVGPDDGGVPPGFSGSDPALFEHGDIFDAVPLREIIGCRKTMPAPADNDDVVARSWLSVAPYRLPIAVAAEGLSDEREKGGAHSHDTAMNLCAKPSPDVQAVPRSQAPTESDSMSSRLSARSGIFANSSIIRATVLRRSEAVGRS